MINRRYAMMILLGAISYARKASADGACPTSNFYMPMGASTCNAYVNPQKIVISSQDNTEWCWAATISNIFAYGGHDVSQLDIVKAGIGQVANDPANISVINTVLNSSWTDSSGKSFQSNANILYSADAMISVPDDSTIIQSLLDNRPLLFCNMSHAMMLISVDYIPPINLPRNVTETIVIDPWPGIGIRSLSAAEGTPVTQGGQLRLIMEVQLSG